MNPTSLQYLSYENPDYAIPAYDAVANVLNIYDYKAGSPQVQGFGYDALNCLVMAYAVYGTGGNYGTEYYTYNDSTGNLASKTGLGSYGYNDAEHPHAVTHLGGNLQYWYDANGSQVRRMLSSGDAWLAYDADNRLVSAANDAIFADGVEGGNFNAWSASQTDGCDLSVATAAALGGTYGMRADLDDNNSIYVEDTRPADEAFYRRASTSRPARSRWPPVMCSCSSKGTMAAARR